MRIPTSKVWRAFPELDGFSDQQCARFVRSARRAWGWRAARGAVMLAAVGAAFLGGGIAAAFVVHAADQSGKWSERTVWIVALLGALVAMAGALGLGLWVRDRLLRWRVRYAIFDRGTCQKCRYSLVGMPVSAENTVVCPECGAVSEVDAALGELTVAEGQRVLRRVDEAILPKAGKPGFITVKRVKKVAKWAAIAVLAVILAVAGWLGIEWYRLARDAELARKERPGIAQLDAVQLKYLPAATDPAAPVGRELFTELHRSFQSVHFRLLARGPFEDDMNGNAIREPWYSGFKPSPALSDFNRDQVEKAGRLANRVINEARQAGIMKKFAELRRSRGGPWAYPTGLLATYSIMDEVSKFRWTLSVLGQWSRNSLERNDLAEFKEGLCAQVELVRIASMYPIAQGQDWALRMESMLCATLRQFALDKPEEAWLQEIDQALAQLDALPRYETMVVEGERVRLMEDAAAFFSDRSAVVRARWEMLTGKAGRTREIEIAVGGYEATRSQINASCDALAVSLKTPAWQRKASPSSGEVPLIYGAVNATYQSLLVRTRDLTMLERESLRAVIALERYRLANGRYPDALIELSPTFLKALPVDPWSGEPLKYRRIDPSGDQWQRGYLLYTVGMDGKDDGGKEDPKDPWKAFREEGRFVDFIINDPTR